MYISGNVEAIKELQSQSITFYRAVWCNSCVDGDQSFLDAKIKALLRGDKVINAVLSSGVLQVNL
ncbi:aspartate aminotransferase domain protein [Anaplasma phagocytophilum str. ApNP]|uniref:Aspartate aminotransferase domain protein n=1 Tax=Anaplasma phagocytophilum str. ApNP TaxID=1359153 RepID=A0A0F3NH85_ANAPH|nr:aspartate aminotransferase domain protein [Anaplasma phagocytophilum str. ApNP]SCV61733.1 hypothetical protein ANAPH2_00069 [Anaplasma phagocytophilum]